MPIVRSNPYEYGPALHLGRREAPRRRWKFRLPWKAIGSVYAILSILLSISIAVNAWEAMKAGQCPEAVGIFAEALRNSR